MSRKSINEEADFFTDDGAGLHRPGTFRQASFGR